MSFKNIPAGEVIPTDIYVVVEIPANSTPIKYEIDKKYDAIFVDRFLATPMFYPANYGYVPNTIADDGDPLDALVITPFPVHQGSIIRSRPIGILDMSDEAGRDSKILAVPHDKLTTIYEGVREPEDLGSLLLDQISHFFENYKDLEAGKWVKVEGWRSSHAALDVILASVKAAEK